MPDLYYFLRNGQVSPEPVPWDDIPISAEQALPAHRVNEDPPPWRPIRVAPPARSYARPPRVIEQTAKRWKGHLLTAAGLSITGMLLLIFGTSAPSAAEPSTATPLGATLLVSGLLYFILARFMSWWHHG